MIKVFIGGVGQGKTVTSVKEILSRKERCFTNFNIKAPYAVRLKKEYIVTKDEKGKMAVNWEFWKNQEEGFDVWIDEAHNIVSSRRAMSSWNVNFMQWVTQIRKILGGTEKNNLYFVTQRLGSLDIFIRDLCHEIIMFEKYESNEKITTRVRERGNAVLKKLPKIWITLTRFKGVNCIEKYNAYMNGSPYYDSKSYYLANFFFQFYDSYEIMEDMGEYV